MENYTNFRHSDADADDVWLARHIDIHFYVII